MARFDQLRELLSPEKAAELTQNAFAPFTDIALPFTNPVSRRLEEAGENLNQATQASALNVLNKPTPDFVPEMMRGPIEDAKTIGKFIAPPVLDSLKLTPSNLAGMVGGTLTGDIAAPYVLPQAAKLAAKGAKYLPGKVTDTLLTNVEDLPLIRNFLPKSKALDAAANRVQVSLESSPGQKTGLIPEEYNAPAMQRKAFHDEMNKIFYDENGDDIIAKELGLPNPQHIDAPGYYNGKMSPGSQEVFPPGTDINKIKQYAARRGMALKQESMGYDNPLYAATREDADLVKFNLKRKPLDSEIESLYNHTGNDNFSIIATPDGVSVRNFSGWSTSPVDNLTFQNQVKAAMHKVIPNDEDVGILFEKHGGDLINGGINNEDYIREIANAEGLRAAGRAERIFGEKVAQTHGKFAKEFGWSNPFQYQGPADTFRYLAKTSPVIKNLPAASGFSAVQSTPIITKQKKSGKFPALRAGLSRL